MKPQQFATSERFARLIALLPTIAETVRLLPSPELQRDAFRLLIRELKREDSTAAPRPARGRPPLSAQGNSPTLERIAEDEKELGLDRETFPKVEMTPVSEALPTLFGSAYHDSILDELAGEGNRDGDESVHSFLIN